MGKPFKRIWARNPKADVGQNIEAWEFRKSSKIIEQIPTYVIAQTRGLKKQERKAIIKKVELEEIKRAEIPIEIALETQKESLPRLKQYKKEVGIEA